jgi:outer membrane protein assembly factor BamD
MKKINLTILTIFIFILTSCSGDKKEISVIKEKELNLQMIEAYNLGMKALEEGDVLSASKKFNEAEIIYPQSEWAPKSSLMSAYSYYSGSYFSDAIMELERFLEVYPKDKNISYAHYLLAMCYYESIIDEKKDLKPLNLSREKFEYVLENYPNTDYAADAKFKLDLIQEILASKEMYVARHYMKKQKWIAAINRLKNVVNNYSTTVYIEEALFRLVEVHYKIGLVIEAQKYAKTLGYNYQSSKWYEKSYALFNKSYKSRKKIVKKKRGKVLKKIKSILD